MKSLTKFVVMILMTCTSAMAAAETPTQLALSQAQKQGLIDSLSDQIARHSAMSDEEILSDLENRAATLVAQLTAAGQPEAAEKAAASYEALSTHLRDGGKELVLAVENSQLQTLMSSDNYLFFYTRAYIAKGLSDGFLLVAICVAMDSVLFPMQLVASIFSGF